MSVDKTYEVTEIVGVSDESFAQAARNCVSKAAQTLQNLGWFEVVNERGYIRNEQVAEFQVTLKVGFRLE